ncbi:MAG TPA: alpha/beta hydrolase [Streptosporangiaceae bacterium]|nr:alpha/beta hydrolase [Streptosporangiaceae bacterium]
MTTYVLVHGAWGGAHGFSKVRPLLTAAGHEVTTPALTGIGERSHLASPQVNLTTHIQDVVNVIWYHDLSDIVLLGFSYGGMVVTGAVSHVADRVRHLVYLDAFLPDDGQALYDLTGQPGGTVLSLGEQWLVPARPREYEDPAEAAFSGPRRTPHPRACFTEPVRVPRQLEDYPFSRTYIKATEEAEPKAFWDAADRARSSPAWRYREIATNHMVPVNRPQELTDMLLELA